MLFMTLVTMLSVSVAHMPSPHKDLCIPILNPRQKKQDEGQWLSWKFQLGLLTSCGKVPNQKSRCKRYP